jgi:hypothetical protein
MRRRWAVVAVAACLTATAGRVEAGFLPDRATLNSILGGGAINEPFEAFNVSDGTSVQLFTMTLNASTVTNGQGPGLVVGGVTIFDSSNLQWNGNNFLGLSSKSASGVGPSRDLSIDFTRATTAFGVDLETYQGFPTTITATVLATDDATPLGIMAGISVPGPSPVFLGFSDAGGVGKVVLTATRQQSFSVVIDNLTFGAAAVPEPGSPVMLSLGLAAVTGLAWHRLSPPGAVRGGG